MIMLIQKNDKNNNVTYTKFQFADGLYKEYDRNNNLVYTKEPDGSEYRIIIED